MKHRFLIALVIGALAAAPLSAGPAALKVRIVTQTANIRSSAGLSAPVVQTVRAGTVFTVIQRTGDWYVIEIPGGGQGYVNKSVIEEVPDAAAAPTPTPVSSQAQPDIRTARPEPPASAIRIGVRAAYLMPSEQAFKDIYGGGLMYGGEIAFRLGQKLRVWIDGGYYQGSGELTYTQEETKLTLIPIGAGVSYDLTAGGVVPYVGAGARYYMYKETNVIGTVSSNGVGFVGFAGVNLRIAKGFLLGLRAGYSSCSMTPADFTINVGGIELGGGLIIEF